MDNFTGEDSTIRWEDWLPTLERAATWNGWSDEESLMLLASRLRGQALVEWNLLSGEEKTLILLRNKHCMLNSTLEAKCWQPRISAMPSKRMMNLLLILSGGWNVVFKWPMAETILAGRREKLFFLTNSKKVLSMASSRVRRCQVVSRTKNSAWLQRMKRIAGLQRRQQYQRGGGGNRENSKHHEVIVRQAAEQSAIQQAAEECYKCGNTEHTHWKCKAPKKESAVQPGERSGTKIVTSATSKGSSPLDPLQYLHSDSDSASDVSSVRVEDKGSQPQKASVSVQGVPVEGVIDSGANIIIMGCCRCPPEEEAVEEV